jgi:hypothetical protein
MFVLWHGLVPIPFEPLYHDLQVSVVPLAFL